jgi:phosphoribosylformylglycinamidine synthase
VGLLTNYDVVVGFGGMVEGDVLVLIGETVGELGASIYLREVLGREDGAPPPVDLDVERTVADPAPEPGDHVDASDTCTVGDPRP